MPLALLVLALLVYALWRALGHAIRRRPRAAGRATPVQRAAFVMVLMVAVHSMLEYPLWYAYFLLPTAFAFGLCLRAAGRERRVARRRRRRARQRTRPFVLASMFLIARRHARRVRLHARGRHLRAARRRAPLAERIADGRSAASSSRHHADYAAATIAEHPRHGR